MMLVLNRVESNKGMSNVVATMIMIVLALTGAGILWFSIREIVNASPLETQCFPYSETSSIIEAKYLNDEEIQIGIKRKISNQNFDKLRISFFPSESVWEISGKKCSDVRLRDKDYGYVCEVVDFGQTKYYVFNVAELEEIQERVVLEVITPLGVPQSTEFVGNTGCFVTERMIT